MTIINIYVILNHNIFSKGEKIMAVNERERGDITFEITEHIGIISEYPTGWRKELNKVVWNGGGEKFDVRDWDPEHEHMSRGITLHKDEAKKLSDLLKAQKM